VEFKAAAVFGEGRETSKLHTSKFNLSINLPLNPRHHKSLKQNFDFHISSLIPSVFVCFSLHARHRLRLMRLDFETEKLPLMYRYGT
jgi:hypothetical protein